MNLARTSLALTLPFLSASLAAQTTNTRFQQVDNHVLPVLSHEVISIASADLDGDGDTDLILGRKHRDMILINAGGGRFVDGSSNLPASVAGYSAKVVLGDVDGDKDLDLVIATNRGKDLLLLNDGKGKFTDVTSTHLKVDGGATATVALADVDGDKDLDLLVGGGWTKSNFIAHNDGRGRFTLSSQTLPRSTTQIEPRDYDGDGDVDLLLRANGSLFLWANNGRGSFTDVSATALPKGISQATTLQVGDVDRDGDDDAVLTRLSGGNLLLLGDGKGKFVDGTKGRLPSTADRTERLLLADLDGDRAPELVFGNNPFFAQANGRDRLFVNDGRGRFTDATSRLAFPDVGFRVESLAAIDADSDGDPDLVVGGDPGTLRLLLNDGKARFVDLNPPFLPRDRDATQVMAAGDIDGDGDVDLFTGVLPRTKLFVNDGRGKFTEEAEKRIPTIAVQPPSVALHDIDKDGDLDFLHSGSSLFLNDGKGVFTDASSRLPQDRFLTRDMAFGDVDKDGDVDIVLGKQRAQNRLYLNDGRGTFRDATSTHMPVDAANTFAVELGDLDGDGDLDLAVGNMFAPNLAVGIDRIYLNDGKGRFSIATTNLPAFKEPTRDLALGDFDGDGDLDLTTVSANLAAGSPGRDRLFFNDGKGKFVDVSAKNLPLMWEFTFALDVADVDADGDLDIVHANDVAFLFPGSPQNRLLLNDGKGVFRDATKSWLPVRLDQTRSVLFADFDGDRDVDVLFGNNAGASSEAMRNRLYFNFSQQLTGSGLVRPGTTHEVEITHWVDSPVNTRFAIPAASVRAIQVPVDPLGLLGLDLSLGVVWPPRRMPPTSTLVHRYAIPNVPAARGLVLYEQAVVFDAAKPASTARLTNAIGQRIN